MEREAFLDLLATRLDRPRLTEAPTRTLRGVSDEYKEHPFGEQTLTVSEWPDRFAAELQALGGHFVLLEQVSALPEHLTALFQELGTESIVTWDRSEFQDWPLDWLWDERGAVAWSGAAEPVSDLPLQTPDVGITTADFGIVNTGTLALFTRPTRSRSASLLPTMHIALLRESQLVPTIGEALAALSRWSGSDIPSSVHFISGPSRSADIENDLSIGVHGPAALTVFLCKGI